jgi:hypothetical protein
MSRNHFNGAHNKHATRIGQATILAKALNYSHSSCTDGLKAAARHDYLTWSLFLSKNSGDEWLNFFVNRNKGKKAAHKQKSKSKYATKNNAK